MEYGVDLTSKRQNDPFISFSEILEVKTNLCVDEKAFGLKKIRLRGWRTNPSILKVKFLMIHI